MNSIKKIGLVFLLFPLLQMVKVNDVNMVVGEWVYLHSITDSSFIQVKFDKHCPVEKMIFIKCNDTKRLRKMPDYVKKNRKGNFFENICCKTYINNGLVDTYFPVAKTIVHTKDTTIHIFNYGLKYKNEYFVDEISNDTMIIYDDKKYLINNKNYFDLKHVFVKVSRASGCVQ